MFGRKRSVEKKAGGKRSLLLNRCGIGGLTLYFLLSVSLFTFSPSTSTPKLPVLSSGVRHAIYINRDIREDRKRGIQDQLSRAGINAIRVSAEEVYNDGYLLKKCWDGGSRKCAGQLGCQKSHVKALSLAIEYDWSHVAVFEDDFEWLNHTNVQSVQQAFKQLESTVPDWHVIAVSLNLQQYTRIRKTMIRTGNTQSSSVIKIHKALASHGYIVRSEMFRPLLRVFEDCDVKGDLETAINTCWQKLQKKYNWYGLHPQLGTQAESFSDIENRVVSYSVEYGMKR